MQNISLSGASSHQPKGYIACTSTQLAACRENLQHVEKTATHWWGSERTTHAQTADLHIGYKQKGIELVGDEA